MRKLRDLQKSEGEKSTLADPDLARAVGAIELAGALAGEGEGEGRELVRGVPVVGEGRAAGRSDARHGRRRAVAAARRRRRTGGGAARGGGGSGEVQRWRGKRRARGARGPGAGLIWARWAARRGKERVTGGGVGSSWSSGPLFIGGSRGWP